MAKAAVKPSIIKVPLLGSGEPYRGTRPSPDPITLGVGEFALGENMRSVNGVATVRNGIDRVLNVNQVTDWAGSDLCGAWFGYLGGRYRRIVAIESQSNNATVLWDLDTNAEITAGSGEFGNTRMISSSQSQYHVKFALVADQLSRTNKLVACNGYDAPRVVFNDGAYKCAAHTAIDAPEDCADYTCYLKPICFFNILSNANTTYTATAVHTAAVDDNTKYHPYTATKGNSCKFTFNTNAVSGDNVTIQNNTTVDPSASRQMWIIVDTWLPNWLDTFKIGISNGGGAVTTLWDPSNPTSYSRPVAGSLDSTTKQLIAINLPYATMHSLTAIDKVTFTYVATEVPYEQFDFWVPMIAFSGSEEGGIQYEVSRYAPAQQAESAAVAIKEYAFPKVGDCGGPAMRGLGIPNVSELRFTYNLRLSNPSTAQVNAGVTQMRLYSKRSQGTDFFLVATETQASYSAGYTFTTGSAGTVYNKVIGATAAEALTPTYASQQLIVAPDEFILPCPVSVAPVFSSGRLLVFSSSDSHERFDTMWGSDFAYPWRFRKAPKTSGGAPKEESGFTVNLPGESVKTSVSSSAGSLVGAVNYIFTDSSVYTSSGFKFSSLAQMTRISPYGIINDNAVAEHDGMVAWHSTNNQIVIFAKGGSQEISYNRIDNRLDPITVSPYAEAEAPITMAFRDSKLYVGYRYTSSYQHQADRILVFDMRQNGWVSDDVLPTETPCYKLVPGQGGSNELVLYIVGRYGTRVKVYEYDSPGLAGDEQDAGVQDIAWKIRTRDRHFGANMPRFSYGRVFVHCDTQVSGEMAVTRGYRPSGVTAASVIDLSSNDDELHRVDRTESLTVTPASSEHWGGAGYVELSGTSPAGFQIFNAYAEVSTRGDSADSA